MKRATSKLTRRAAFVGLTSQLATIAEIPLASFQIFFSQRLDELATLSHDLLRSILISGSIPDDAASQSASHARKSFPVCNVANGHFFPQVLLESL
jgi:hypothetical protein